MKRACPICAETKSNIIFHDHNRREGYSELEGDYVECISCKMRYLTNIPSFEEMGGKYTDIYVEPDIEKMKSQLKSKGDIKPNGKKVLDIGCNFGTGLTAYYNTGWDVYGIDLNHKAIEDCKKYLGKDNFFCSTIEDADFGDGTFDRIQTYHVLEHIYEPKPFLKRCYDLLKDEGTLSIRVPHGRSLEMAIFSQYASQSWIPFHVNMFGKSNIIQILEEIGLKHIEVTTIPAPIWWLLSWRQFRGNICLERGVTNFHVSKVQVILLTLFRPILFIFSIFGKGDELVVTARK